MGASRAILFAATILIAALGASPTIAQTPGLVVDAASGKVLFAERATDPWYPASITKLMTVYVALDQARQGRVSMNSVLTMSESAAAEPPSKLGLRPGMTMTLDNALKVIMVKSANDIAMMIGENLGGSVEGFAAMMNDAARRIGMRQSNWTNPNGLPDNRQHTTARDMAVLARALITEFPEHDALFRIGALKLGNVVMYNHNGLLGRYPGADGMKTGFICSGGFSIVASATQNGRRIIAVVMGYPSARERDFRTADLFDAGFSSWGGGWGSQDLDSLAPPASFEPTDLRQAICGPKRRAPQEDDQVARANRGDQNASNPVASLFSPAAMNAPTLAGGAIPGSRREFGPRVAFDATPIWLGAKPGDVSDQALAGGGRRRLAVGRAGRTRVSRVSAPGPAAKAFTTASANPSAIISGGETKPKPGAVGQPAAGTRRKLGAVAAAPPVSGTNPGAVASTKVAAKPKPKPSVAAKPNTAAKPEIKKAAASSQ